MTYPDLATALRGPQSPDWGMPRRASCAVEDAYCREILGIVGDYAARMFSDPKHRGAKYQRLQVLRALDRFCSRLSSLEVIRHAGAYVAEYDNSGPQQGKSR
jgi:hypothetical protein